VPRKSFCVSLFLLFMGFSSHLSNAQQVVQCQGHAELNVFERIQFIQVSESARPSVSAQFLSELGCGRQMLDALSRLEAKIDYADEKSGYALVTIPRAKLLDTLDVAGIEYAYTRDDDRMYYEDPAAKVPQSDRKPEPIPQFDIPYPHVAGSLTPDGPYFAANEIGLSELWRQHPEADGRGVRVAVADEGLDLLHPELQEGKEADGKTVPKVADLVTLTSPQEDASWVQMGDPIRTDGRSFTAAGRTWTAPSPGDYRFGIYKQDLVLGPEYNAPSKKVSLSVGVLWDKKLGKVWVDTAGDGMFINDQALGDYGATHDIGWFGKKAGEDDNRIPFGVKIDNDTNSIYIRIGGEHGNLVSGALAGNTWAGGLYDGAAPSAQVIDENLGRSTLLAAMVEAFKRPDVSVVNRSGGIGRAGYTGTRAGIEDFAQHVLEREIAVYDKPMAAYSAAAGTIHVNDYAGPEMLRRNRQLGPPYKDTINSFVWDGLVNVVLAPSANLETDSRYKPQDLVFPDGLRYMWTDGKKNPPAPDGYVIGANNSPTIPVVSGLLADLISEAKREHVRYDAIRLNNAVFTGAHLLKGIPVSSQGYGLINAAQSWDQLVRMAKADDPKSPELTSFTVSQFEAGKTVDVQEFHQDLARAGEKVEGEIWITRYGGYAEGRRYTFSLRGDDSSFELIDREAILVRDKAVRVRFRSNGVPGWNIAFLELQDAETGVVMQDVPLSVRAPNIPEQIAPGVDKYQSTIPALTSENLYVHVGEDVQAARYVMRIPYTGPDNISTRSGPGLRYRTTAMPPGDPVDSVHHVGPVETLQSLVVNDAPGNQGIYWENFGRPEYATQYDGPAPDVPVHAELTVTKFAVAIKRDGNSLILKNEKAAIDGRTEVYDATLKTQSLTGVGLHATSETETTLPDHLAEWRLKVTANDSQGMTADVYVLNCAGKSGCYIAATQQISPEAKTLVIDKPAAGKWIIAVRSRGQVTYPITYSINEALLVSSATSIQTSDGRYASGESWTSELPKKQCDSQYAAFHIAGTSSAANEKNGLVIAMTPLEADAP
jgi:hypothetical protein